MPVRWKNGRSETVFAEEHHRNNRSRRFIFCGCVLHYICEHGLYGLNEENLTEMLRFANAAASMITTRKGALRVMPSQEEIRHLLEMK